MLNTYTKIELFIPYMYPPTSRLSNTNIIYTLNLILTPFLIAYVILYCYLVDFKALVSLRVHDPATGVNPTYCPMGSGPQLPNDVVLSDRWMVARGL